MASESDSDDEATVNAKLLLSLLSDDEEDEEKFIEEEEEEGAITTSSHQQLEQSYYLNSTRSTLLIRQLPSQGLSFQLWPAASTLVSLLDGPTSSFLLPTIPAARSPSILELGSGTGLVGIAAASVLGARVTLTDLPHVLPNLLFNADANGGVIAAAGGSVAVRGLSWGNVEDHEGFSSDSFDVVMASDVVYFEELIDPLLKTLSWFVKGEVVFLMGHLRRWKKRDAAFFRKARKLFDYEVVHTDPPLPGNRIGVAVYCFRAKKKQCCLLISTLDQHQEV